jgi:molybdopterin synthase catalytic subunit
MTERPLDIRALEARVAQPSAGAIASFQGVVRDHHEGRRVSGIRYEAYVPMAEKLLRSLCEEVAAAWPLAALAAEHRIGELAVGEASVVIAAASVHRREAFAACMRLIDRIKEDLPVWKLEHTDQGDIWAPANCADHRS